MESKTIIRVQKNTDYTIINNTSINDKRLSWKAKAIHVFMLSKPDNWTFYNEEIQQWAKDGMSSFTSGLSELKKLGYIKKERRRAAGGKFEWVTIVYEVPQNLSPEEDQPSTEKPPMENLPMVEKMQGNQGFVGDGNFPPYPQKPYVENPAMDNPSMENPRMEKPSMDNRQLLSTESLSTYSLITDKQKINTENVVVVEEAPPKNELQNVFEFYQQNGFGMTMNDITVQKIDTWCQELSDELVVYAMQIAIERNRVSWSYAEGILRNWSNKNVKSIADVDALVAQFEASRQQANKPAPYKQGRNQGRTENVPEWFNNRNQQPTSDPQLPAASTSGFVDFEAERQKILSKLSTAQLSEEMNGTV